MREKLVQILMDTRSYGNRSYAELASDIVAELRCDKCKHWNRLFGISADDALHCRAIDDSDSIQVSSAGTFTKPDFFCALWEAK